MTVSLTENPLVAIPEAQVEDLFEGFAGMPRILLQCSVHDIK